MPVPKPRDEETEEEFIKRCMSDAVMLEEYPDNDVRAGVCYTTWRNSKGEAIMEHKALAIELKEEKEGSFTARIATLNVIDLDGDITKPGAFPKNKTVLVSAYQHGSWIGALPVGKATIREKDDEVLAEGQFNLNTVTGQEHYQTAKFSPELMEWSYGFEVKEWEHSEIDGVKVRIIKKVEPFEISPVVLGAGVNTALLAIKSQTYECECIECGYVLETTKHCADITCPECGGEMRRFERPGPGKMQKGIISYGTAHPDGTPKAAEDTDWDAGEEVKEADIDDLKVMCAWVDSENSDTKGAYKLPHHKASGQHSVVWKAVAAAMAALMGARGGIDIPSADKKGIYNHLKKHYDEFEKEPPEFHSEGMTYLNQAESALAAVTDLIDRTKSLADLRRKEGRTISSANRERMKQLLNALQSTASDLQDFLDATMPDADKALRSYLLGVKEKVKFIEGEIRH